MKNERQSLILELIDQQNIETQNQLMLALQERGISTTQATLSRDIRDMRLTKEAAPGGGYRYVAPASGFPGDHSLRLQKIFRESVISCDTAQNILVIRTLPGLAPAACSALGNMEIDGLVGTIAGDDTAFLAMRDNAAARQFYDEIGSLF